MRVRSAILCLSLFHPALTSEVAEIYCSPSTLNDTKLSLVIANGGGGQTGLIEYLATQYYTLRSRKRVQNVCIGWKASNTAVSLKALESGESDISIVYDVGRIYQSIKSHHAFPRIAHTWMDRFMWTGPVSNPAAVDVHDTVYEAMRKIAKSPDAYWLARCDDSTISNKDIHVVTNVVGDIRRELGMPELSKRELLSTLVVEGYNALPASERENDAGKLKTSEVFASVSWDRAIEIIKQTSMHAGFEEYRELVKDGFYRPIQLLPAQATIRADELGYYTMSDHGIWGSLEPSRKKASRIILDGKTKETAFFLNPAYAVMSTRSKSSIARDFMNYLADSRAMSEIIPKFYGRVPGSSEALYDIPHQDYLFNKFMPLAAFVKRIPFL